MLRDKNRQKEKGAEEAMWALGDKIKEELRRSHNEKCHDHTLGMVILKWNFQK